MALTRVGSVAAVNRDRRRLSDSGREHARGAAQLEHGWQSLRSAVMTIEHVAFCLPAQSNPDPLDEVFRSEGVRPQTPGCGPKMAPFQRRASGFSSGTTRFRAIAGAESVGRCEPLRLTRTG